MADPDKDRPTEIDLEMKQRQRLMDMFSLVERFDDRQAVITFCEKLIDTQRKD